MGIGEKVERDVRSVAEYWGRRKREFIEEPALAFEQIVRPAIYFESEPDPLVETQVNATFTEWLLFDCMLDERGTLLERYVRKPPAGVADSRLARLRQVAETHEFSEYAIMRRDPGTGTLECSTYTTEQCARCETRVWRGVTTGTRGPSRSGLAASMTCGCPLGRPSCTTAARSIPPGFPLTTREPPQACACSTLPMTCLASMARIALA